MFILVLDFQGDLKYKRYNFLVASLHWTTLMCEVSNELKGETEVGYLLECLKFSINKSQIDILVSSMIPTSGDVDFKLV